MSAHTLGDGQHSTTRLADGTRDERWGLHPDAWGVAHGHPGTVRIMGLRFLSPAIARAVLTRAIETLDTTTVPGEAFATLDVPLIRRPGSPLDNPPSEVQYRAGKLIVVTTPGARVRLTSWWRRLIGRHDLIAEV